MLQYLKLHYANDSQSALYTSLDSLYFTQHTLSELAEQFYLKGGNVSFWMKYINIHPGARRLKNIYDEFPELKIVFTGSSSTSTSECRSRFVTPMHIIQYARTLLP